MLSFICAFIMNQTVKVLNIIIEMLVFLSKFSLDTHTERDTLRSENS